MDPWLSLDGAFQGSWFQYPRNDHLDRAALLDCDWVTVSHEHLDHADLSVLTQLPPATRVLIPRYQSPNHRERLLRGGVSNVIEVPAWERFPLNTQGDWVTFIPEESPMCQDAAVLLVAGGKSLLHMNDARLTAAQGRRAALEVGGALDVLALQTSSATWHPICYEYPEEVLARICAEKRVAKFKAVARFVRAVRPRLAVPFAGPPCFLDPELFRHNRWLRGEGLFPTNRQAYEWLLPRLHGQALDWWAPGDVFDVDSGRCERDPQREASDERELAEDLERYAEERRANIERTHAAFPAPGEELAEAFEEHFMRLGALNSYFLRRIGMTIRFDVRGPGGGRWDVRLGPDDTEVDLSGADRDVQYRFTVDSRWLAPVITGAIAWEDLFLSLRFSAWRHPDIYNDYLVGLLKHAEPEVLAAVEAYEKGRDENECTVLHTDRGDFEVSRYCPHAGEDLSRSGVVVDGTLRCLGHNFEFDLQTGKCLNAACDPIRTRPLGASALAEGR